MGGKTYKLRCEVVEVYPMTCKKCGGQYTTNFKIEEVKGEKDDQVTNT